MPAVVLSSLAAATRSKPASKVHRTCTSLALLARLRTWLAGHLTHCTNETIQPSGIPDSGFSRFSSVLGEMHRLWGWSAVLTCMSATAITSQSCLLWLERCHAGVLPDPLPLPQLKVRVRLNITTRSFANVCLKHLEKRNFQGSSQRTQQVDTGARSLPACWGKHSQTKRRVHTLRATSLAVSTKKKRSKERSVSIGAVEKSWDKIHVQDSCPFDNPTSVRNAVPRTSFSEDQPATNQHRFFKLAIQLMWNNTTSSNVAATQGICSEKELPEASHPHDDSRSDHPRGHPAKLRVISTKHKILFDKLQHRLQSTRHAALKSLKFKLKHGLMEASIASKNLDFMLSIVKMVPAVGPEEVADVVEFIQNLNDSDPLCFLKAFSEAYARGGGIACNQHLLLKYAGTGKTWLPEFENFHKALKSSIPDIKQIKQRNSPQNSPESTYSNPHPEERRQCRRDTVFKVINNVQQHIVEQRVLNSSVDETIPDPFGNKKENHANLVMKVAADPDTSHRLGEIIRVSKCALYDETREAIHFKHSFCFPEVALTQDDSRFLFDARVHHLFVSFGVCVTKLFHSLLGLATHPFPLSPTGPSAAATMTQFSPASSSSIITGITPSVSASIMAADKHSNVGFVRNRAIGLIPVLQSAFPCLFLASSTVKKTLSDGVKSDLLRKELYLTQLAIILSNYGADSLVCDRALLSMVDLTLKIIECKVCGQHSLASVSSSKSSSSISYEHHRMALPLLTSVLAEIATKIPNTDCDCSIELLPRILNYLREVSPRHFKAYVEGKTIIHAIRLAKKYKKNDVTTRNSDHNDKSYGNHPENTPLKALVAMLKAIPYEVSHLKRVIRGLCSHLTSSDVAAKTVCQKVLLSLLQHHHLAVQKITLQSLCGLVPVILKGSNATDAIDFLLSSCVLYHVLMYGLGNADTEHAAWQFLETLSINLAPLFRQALRPMIPLLVARVGNYPEKSGLRTIVTEGMSSEDLVYIHVQGLFLSDPSSRAAASRAIRPHVLSLLHKWKRKDNDDITVIETYKREVEVIVDPIRRLSFSAAAASSVPFSNGGRHHHITDLKSSKGRTRLAAASTTINSNGAPLLSSFSRQDVLKLVTVFTEHKRNYHIRREAAIQLIQILEGDIGLEFISILGSAEILSVIERILTGRESASVYSFVLTGDLSEESKSVDLVHPALMLLRLAIASNADHKIGDNVSCAPDVEIARKDRRINTRLLANVDLLDLTLPWIYTKYAPVALLALEIAAFEAFSTPLFDPIYTRAKSYKISNPNYHLSWHRYCRTYKNIKKDDCKSERRVGPIVSIPSLMDSSFDFPFLIERPKEMDNYTEGGLNENCRILKWMIASEEKHQQSTSASGDDYYLQRLWDKVASANDFNTCQSALRTIKCYQDVGIRNGKLMWKCNWMPAARRFLGVLPSSGSDLHLFTTLLQILSNAFDFQSRRSDNLTPIIPREAVNELVSLVYRLVPLVDVPTHIKLSEALPSSIVKLKQQDVNYGGKMPLPAVQIAIIHFLESILKFGATPLGISCVATTNTVPATILEDDVKFDSGHLGGKQQQLPQSSSTKSLNEILGNLTQAVTYLIACSDQNVSSVEIDAGKPWPLALQIASIRCLVTISSSCAFPKLLKELQANSKALINILSLPSITNAFLRKSPRRYAACALSQVLNICPVLPSHQHSSAAIDRFPKTSLLTKTGRSFGQLDLKQHNIEGSQRSRDDNDNSCHSNSPSSIDILPWLSALSRDREDINRISAYRIASSMFREGRFKSPSISSDRRVAMWGPQASLLLASALDTVLQMTGPYAVNLRVAALRALTAKVTDMRNVSMMSRPSTSLSSSSSSSSSSSFEDQLLQVIPELLQTTGGHHNLFAPQVKNGTTNTMSLAAATAELLAAVLTRIPDKAKKVAMRADNYTSIVKILKNASSFLSSSPSPSPLHLKGVENSGQMRWYMPPPLTNHTSFGGINAIPFSDYMLGVECRGNVCEIGIIESLAAGTFAMDALRSLVQSEEACVSYMLASKNLMVELLRFLEEVQKINDAENTKGNDDNDDANGSEKVASEQLTTRERGDTKERMALSHNFINKERRLSPLVSAASMSWYSLCLSLISLQPDSFQNHVSPQMLSILYNVSAGILTRCSNEMLVKTSSSMRSGPDVLSKLVMSFLTKCFDVCPPSPQPVTAVEYDPRAAKAEPIKSSLSLENNESPVPLSSSQSPYLTTTTSNKSSTFLCEVLFKHLVLLLETDHILGARGRQIEGRRAAISPHLLESSDVIEKWESRNTVKQLVICSNTLAKLLSRCKAAKLWLVSDQKIKNTFQELLSSKSSSSEISLSFSLPSKPIKPLRYLFSILERSHSLACLHRLEPELVHKQMESVLHKRLSYLFSIVQGLLYNGSKELKSECGKENLICLLVSTWSSCVAATRDKYQEWKLKTKKHNHCIDDTLDSDASTVLLHRNEDIDDDAKTPNEAELSPSSSYHSNSHLFNHPSYSRNARPRRSKPSPIRKRRKRRIWWGLDGRRHVETLPATTSETATSTGTTTKGKENISVVNTRQEGNKSGNILHGKKGAHERINFMGDEKETYDQVVDDCASAVAVREHNRESSSDTKHKSRIQKNQKRRITYLLDYVLNIIGNYAHGDMCAKEHICKKMGGTKSQSMLSLILNLTRNPSPSLPPHLSHKGLEILSNLAVCPAAAGPLTRARIPSWAWTKACTKTNSSYLPSSKRSSKKERSDSPSHDYLRLLHSLCLTSIGRRSIADLLIPRHLGSLASMLVEKSADPNQKIAAHILLRNLSFCTSVKTPILSDTRMLQAFFEPLMLPEGFSQSMFEVGDAFTWVNEFMEDKENRSHLVMEYASHTLWSCIHDNQKGRAMLSEHRRELEKCSKKIRLLKLVLDRLESSPAFTPDQRISSLKRAVKNFGHIDALCNNRLQSGITGARK
eukprot:jgi/Bigna1/74153/fgenesh1_pg.27_\